MIFEKEFKESKSKDEFIAKILKIDRKLKKHSAERRYYKLRQFFINYREEKIINKDDILEKYNKVTEPSVFSSKPNRLKIIEIIEMKKFGIKFTNEYLIKYGYKQSEINWLQEWNFIVLEDGIIFVPSKVQLKNLIVNFLDKNNMIKTNVRKLFDEIMNEYKFNKEE